MSRFRASAIHFLLSALVGATLLALCWYVWYPAPMLTAIGGHEIFLLIVGIDVVIGPLLTLVVFQKDKKSLKADLAVIAILQVMAMAYGVQTLLEVRPAYVAALGKKFQVVLATQVTEANLTKAGATVPWWGPLWVGTKAPENSNDALLVHDLEAIGAGRGHVPILHIPYEQMQEEVLRNSLSIADLKTRNAGSATKIDEWLAEVGLDENTAKFQPIDIAASEYVVIIDAATGKVMGIAPFSPY